MKRILLLIKHQQNCQILAQWLISKYCILSPQNADKFAIEGEQLLEQEFDLCFIDFAAIHDLRQQIIAKRKKVIPLFLPFIFLTSLQDVGISTDGLEFLIDDIIYLPIKKVELETKLRVLLRSRSYALQLQAAKEELNQALTQEKKLNQLKSRFVSIVSHEFRNPLNGISGMTQVLQAYGDTLSPTKKAEVLAGLQRNVVKMTNLLDDVLIISRKDLEKLQYNPAPIELKTFCLGLISEIKTIFDRKQSINFIYDEQSQRQISLDHKLMHHILINLISNACKYSPPNSAIDFKVSCLESKILFVIADRGIGIPAADIPHLFESFFRASNSQGYQGTGLGLAIAKQYVELHQGKITVESELDVGTTFTIELNL